MSWQSLVHAARTRAEVLANRPRTVALAQSARRYAEHGWDVTPGAPLRGDLFDCGRLSCRITTCHPAFDDWETNSASHDPLRIAAWWRDQPYTVLLMTGRTFDVLEVPAALGRAAVNGRRLADIGAPIAIAPRDRWMFLVQPGCELDRRLSERADVVLHSRGSWIPAPPTRQPDGRSRWRVDPRTLEFRLGDPALIQALVLAHLPGARQSPTTYTTGTARTAGPGRTANGSGNGSGNGCATPKAIGMTNIIGVAGAAARVRGTSRAAAGFGAEPGIGSGRTAGRELGRDLGREVGREAGPGLGLGPSAGTNSGRHFEAATGRHARHRHQVG